VGELQYKGTANAKDPLLKFTGSVEVNDLATQDKVER